MSPANLDQNFVGNTPSTINVPAGKHSISVRRIGFQDWTREMNFSGGTITLSAVMVAGSNTTVTPSSPQNADMTPPEMSVADAARVNKAAKANQPLSNNELAGEQDIFAHLPP
jgi:hypothetical protein